MTADGVAFSAVFPDDLQDLGASAPRASCGRRSMMRSRAPGRSRTASLSAAANPIEPAAPKAPKAVALAGGDRRPLGDQLLRRPPPGVSQITTGHVACCALLAHGAEKQLPEPAEAARADDQVDPRLSRPPHTLSCPSTAMVSIWTSRASARASSSASASGLRLARSGSSSSPRRWRVRSRIHTHSCRSGSPRLRRVPTSSPAALPISRPNGLPSSRSRTRQLHYHASAHRFL